MAKKHALVYLSTYIDVELDEDFDNSSDEEIKEYVEKNLSDYITSEELYENTCLEPLEIDITTMV